MGIRNGIDMDLWDPENNQWLPMPYSADNVVEGKAAARKVRAAGTQQPSDYMLAIAISCKAACWISSP